jgi:hypothetical protein
MVDTQIKHVHGGAFASWLQNFGLIFCVFLDPGSLEDPILMISGDPPESVK